MEAAAVSEKPLSPTHSNSNLPLSVTDVKKLKKGLAAMAGNRSARKISAPLKRHVKLVTLEVRRSNDAARSLYAGFGFRQIGVRQRYYSDNGEDAIVMQLALRPGES